MGNGWLCGELVCCPRSMKKDECVRESVRLLINSSGMMLRVCTCYSMCRVSQE
jgi:hypothetical protein